MDKEKILEILLELLSRPESKKAIAKILVELSVEDTAVRSAFRWLGDDDSQRRWPQ